MKKIYEIDKDGFMTYGSIEIEPSDFGSEGEPYYVIPEGYVEEPLPRDKYGGQLTFWKPKWNGEIWVEGKTQEEFDEERMMADLVPSPEEMYNADFEIRMITLLFEMEVI